jgi:hypothetical protein
MIGLGSTQVASGTSPLSPLADVKRDGGFMLIGLGIADALTLLAVFHPQAYYLVEVICAAVVLAAAFELLVYRKNQGLTRAVGRSTPAPAAAPVRRHQELVRFGLSMAVGYGVLTAIAAGLSEGSSSHGLLVLVTAMMVGFGVVELIEAERVRRWEREQDSELLVSITWGLTPTYSYFVRPLTRP